MCHCFYTVRLVKLGDACGRDVIVEIKVDEGDTLSGLAQVYHLPYKKLLAANKGGLCSHQLGLVKNMLCHVIRNRMWSCP